jgi:hypothetical protein
MKPIHPQRLSNKASPGTLLKRAHDLAQRRKLREVTGRDLVRHYRKNKNAGPLSGEHRE